MNFIQKKFKTISSTSYLNEPDYFLFILVSILIITSIIFSYSLTVYTIEFMGYNQFHYIFRQGLVGIISILMMWIMSRLNPDKSVHFIGISLLTIGSFLMLIMPFLPSSLVTAAGGANRWIRLPGFSLSPVELFKIGFVYFLSWSFYRKIINQPKKGLFGDLLMLSPYILLFFAVVAVIAILQKDLGQVVLLAIIMITLILFANRSIKIILFFGVVSILGLLFLIIIAPHRIQRLHSWWSMVQDTFLSLIPALEPYLRIKNLPEPYQVSHSLNAIHNGGLFGQGVGLGNLKMGFLSEVHTDFVLAGIIEEIGVIGFGILLFILFLIIWRIFKISKKVENKVYHLFTIGIALIIIIAFLINALGITGIIPIKGIAVPFLSYGGSSLFTLSLAMGLVLAISRTAKEYKPIKQPEIKKQKPIRIVT